MDGLLKRIYCARGLVKGITKINTTVSKLESLPHMVTIRRAAHDYFPPDRPMKGVPTEEEAKRGLTRKDILERDRRLTPVEVRERYVRCTQAVRRTIKKCKFPPWKTIDYMINADSCVNDPCFGNPIRLDVERYKPSDKMKRKYSQTWIECYPSPRERREPCNFKPPQIERRIFPPCPKLKEKPKTACEQNCDLLDEICEKAKRPQKKVYEVKKKVRGKCEKIRLANCPSARKIGSCRNVPNPSNCLRIPTRYPSYSECIRCSPKAPKPNECHCHARISMCDVWEEYRRRHPGKKD